MICKSCGRKSHYCSSCDYDEYMSEGYCDAECLIKSSFYEKEKGIFMALLDRMPEDSIRCLKEIEDNKHDLLSAHYIQWLEKRLK